MNPKRRKAFCLTTTHGLTARRLDAEMRVYGDYPGCDKYQPRGSWALRIG